MTEINILQRARQLVAENHRPYDIWLTLTYEYPWHQCSAQPDTGSATICSREDGLRSYARKAFHFVGKKGCEDLAWCVYEDSDGITTKLRRHKVGECPDSKYMY